MMGNLVAAVASKLIIPQKGIVQGDSPEAIFAKAEYYLDHGLLHDAVSQLSLLQGMPASIVRYVIVHILLLGTKGYQGLVAGCK